MSPFHHHPRLIRPRFALAVGVAAAMTSGAAQAASPAMSPTAPAPGGSTIADGLTRLGDWMVLLVPPGFTPPAAALLVFAVGLAVWLAGGRYLRIALATGGGLSGAVLALRLLPPAGADAIDWAPIGVAAVLGAIAAAAARRLVATAGLGVALGLMAPAAVIAWDGMAAPHLGKAGPESEPVHLARAPGEEPPPSGASSRSIAAATPSPDAPAVNGDPKLDDEPASGTGTPRTQTVVAASSSVPAPPATVLSRPEPVMATPVALAWGGGGAAGSSDQTAVDELSAAAFAGASGAARRRFDAATRQFLARVRSSVTDEAAVLGGVDRATTLVALAVGGLVAGLGLGLTRSEFAARAATATAGAALVLLGGLHLPAGLAPGGWIGPTAPEPVLLAWIALSGLGATLQWSYRPRSADIGR